MPAEVAGLRWYEEMTTASVATEAFGRKVRTLNIKSLIKAKRAAGRDKDLMILPELESLAASLPTKGEIAKVLIL